MASGNGSCTPSNSLLLASPINWHLPSSMTMGLGSRFPMWLSLKPRNASEWKVCAGFRWLRYIAGKKPMERGVTRARLRTLREVLLATISSR